MKHDLKARNGRKYGHFRDSHDPRDFKFKAVASSTPLVPVDLRDECPEVRDQLDLGACTAFGTTSLVDFVRNKQGLAPWAPSPLFTYYCTRKMEKTIKWDSGASVRDALKSTVNYGVVKESDWKYKPAKFAKKPPMLVFNGAKMNQTIQYHRILDGVITDMKACLAEGYPFIFGFEVYDTFESDVANTTGVIPMPNKSTDQLLGGHCMMVVGWKLIDGVEYFIAQNSWSDTWGDAGYCYLPVAYFADTSLTSDLWTIRLIE